jgi:hypothetical protein
MNMDFEQFLMERFNETVVNTENDPGKDSDRFHDMFCDWLEMLPRENILAYADDYSESRLRAFALELMFKLESGLYHNTEVVLQEAHEMVKKMVLSQGGYTDRISNKYAVTTAK